MEELKYFNWGSLVEVPLRGLFTDAKSDFRSINFPLSDFDEIQYNSAVINLRTIGINIILLSHECACLINSNIARRDCLIADLIRYISRSCGIITPVNIRMTPHFLNIHKLDIKNCDLVNDSSIRDI